MIYLYGASGHGKVITEILETSGSHIVGFIDDNKLITEFLGYSVEHELSDIHLNSKADLIVSIGNNTIRKRIAESCNMNFGKAIHFSANISARSSLGQGTVIMPGVCVNCDAKIGEHVILNTNCVIEHDCWIDKFVHISPQAALGGSVSIGEGTHIGLNSSVIQGIKIGKWVTVGAGTVIINDIPDYAVVVGNPGKIIKYNTL